MFALAYLAVLRKTATGGEDPLNHAADLLPLTVPEVRHLLWHMVWNHPPRPEMVLHWSKWRRKHQQRVRRAHLASTHAHSNTLT
jgi:hypothetical protein